MRKVQFDMKLYDDESTAEKLTVMNKLDAMHDDERNEIPQNYYDLLEGIELGETLRISLEIFK